ncbi:MAG: hypothetical protein V4640_06925 [Verrucomicrobiota bacterium]
MAWRIEDAVAHGEIDNTVAGHTTGRIWLIGREEPLILSLDGDCWRDLAGTRLQFENPDPVAVDDADSLDVDQAGLIGDMTASRKCKVPLVSEEEYHALYQNNREIPHEWRNTLYLEWFSEINGRVVIESSDFELSVSPHEWQMDEDEENAQKMANLNAMRDFMAQVIRRRDPEGPEPDVPMELDEFAWEERLKESDRLTDAYQEVLEKYLEDEDSEQKEAFVMGWDGLLDALAERDEAGGEDDGDTGISFPELGIYGLEADDDDEDDDDFPRPARDDGFGDEPEHPLQVKAQELAMRAMDLIEKDAGPGTPSYQLMTSLLQVSGKLAGVLHGGGGSFEPEAGFVLAVLKRCMNWLNDAMGACKVLVDEEQDPDQKAALAHLRSSALEIRDDIVALRRELK